MEADGLVRVVPRGGYSGPERAPLVRQEPVFCLVRCGVLWHETAGQGPSGAAKLSLVLRSGRRGRRFKSGHLDQLRRYATPARQAHRRETTSRAVPVVCIQMVSCARRALPRDAVVPRFVTDTVWFALRIVEICSPARSAL